MENKKLIGMTDFVLETLKDRIGKSYLDYRDYAYNKMLKIENYANFLKKPLTLQMFVPCELVDGVWVVLEEPEKYSDFLLTTEDFGNLPYIHCNEWFEACDEYSKAKERCLFDEFWIVSSNSVKISNNYISIDFLRDVIYLTDFTKEFPEVVKIHTIEDLTKHDLQLTPTALKQIGI